jgi:hypothetical protein
MPRALHVEQRRRVLGIGKNERGGEVDRLRARAELRVGLLPGVQAQRVELVGLWSRHWFGPVIRKALTAEDTEDAEENVNKNSTQIRKECKRSKVNRQGLP